MGTIMPRRVTGWGGLELRNEICPPIQFESGEINTEGAQDGGSHPKVRNGRKDGPV
jgi:hypothetical protein